jgi:hypothetical protein
MTRKQLVAEVIKMLLLQKNMHRPEHGLRKRI